MKAWAVKIVCYGDSQREAWQQYLADLYEMTKRMPVNSLVRSPGYDTSAEEDDEEEGDGPPSPHYDFGEQEGGEG